MNVVNELKNENIFKLSDRFDTKLIFSRGKIMIIPTKQYGTRERVRIL